MKARAGLLVVAGMLFGAGLALSGMTDPAKVQGFLDVAGAWDPSLAWVMAGALGTFGGTLVWVRRAAPGGGWFGTRLPSLAQEPIDRRLVLGSMVFGIGWGASGMCPGPALANLAAFRADAGIFVAAMAGGMILARVRFGADMDSP
jgi:hypothetical protein